LNGTVDLTDFGWSVIAPLLPNKVRGVKRADDRRVLNGIFWRLRTGAPWADFPGRYGPHTTCVSRFYRWRKAGVWDRILQPVSKAYDGKLHDRLVLDPGASARRQRSKKATRSRSVGRSRDGLTTKIHALVDASGLAIVLKITEGQAHDGRSAQDMLS
jgi:transposase